MVSALMVFAVLQVLCDSGIHFHHTGERHWHFHATMGSQDRCWKGESQTSAYKEPSVG